MPSFAGSVRKCTCLVDTESDSEDECAAPPVSSISASGCGALVAGDAVAAAAARMGPIDLRRKVSGYRDAISTSTALHNSEALRHAQVLQNVFCACYDVETVISQVVQRRERSFSPVQTMLLRQENIATVFRYATTLQDCSTRGDRLDKSTSTSSCGSSINSSSSSTGAPTSLDPERYRRSIVATEIILKFYLKAMAWHGQPKAPAPAPSPRSNKGVRSPTKNGSIASPRLMFSPPTSPTQQQQRRRFSADTPSGVTSPSHREILSFGTTFKAKAAAHKRRNPFAQSHTTATCSLQDVANGLAGTSGLDAVDSAAVRGYLLRLDDLTETEWKSIFAQLFKFLWYKKRDSMDAGSGFATGSGLGMQVITEKSTTGGRSDEDTPVDSVLVANMSKIVKHFMVFPTVHKLLASLECPGPILDGVATFTTLFPALAVFAYSTDIATLLHGVIHVSQRRQLDLDGIMQSIVYQIVSVQPSSSSSRCMGNGTPGAQAFSVKKPRHIHETVSGCADILAKILTQQFPNTFRYYIHTKVQLASFESVETFERELFPPKIPPSDPALHADIKSAAMTALLDDPETLVKIADIALAEIRFLDAYHSTLSGIPPTLVSDVIRCAIECSLTDRPQLELFLPCVHRLVETFCSAINFHQHMTTITEFASRDCFSDSDSDDVESGDDGLNDGGDDDNDDEDDDHEVVRANRVAAEEEEDDPAADVKDSPRSGGFKLALSPVTTVDESEDGRRSMKYSITSSTSSLCFSPTSGRQLANHRPLTSILLIVNIVEFMDVVIRMGVDAIDNRLMRLDLSTSLLELFEKYPKANVLHCRLLKLFVTLFDRNTSGRVNNPFLRSVFRPPNSIQELIMKKLHKSLKNHPYDPHLAILGVKIDKICSSPSLQQELIRQYCTSTAAWTEFASSLVSRHYQQMDALDDLAVSIVSTNNGVGNGGLINRRAASSMDGIDEVFPLSRMSSSSCDFLTNELQPFRRLPMEKEGFGSSQNLAMGTDAVLPTDMLRSRAQSQFPQSIIDILRSDTATSFEATEDERVVVGFAYQKLAKWVKVQLKFDKITCLLIVHEVAKLPTTTTSSSNTIGSTSATGGASGANRGAVAGTPSTSGGASIKKPAAISTTKLKQLWMQHKPQWTAPRPKKFVVCTARKWIAFGRTVKNPNVGAFGFQVDVFDRIREEDQTLTFVTRSEQTRSLWFESLQNAVMEARTLRHQSFTDVDEEANIMLVKCVATQREDAQMVYLALPDVHVLAPVISSSFSLKSEVPEDIPFWGTFQGPHGVSKYCSLFNSCLHVVAVQEKRVYASGYSVIVEFEATLQAIDGPTAPTTPVTTRPTTTNASGSTSALGRVHLHLQLAPPPDPEKTVICSFTDTYLVTGNQIISMTRTIADSEKLVKILCDDIADSYEAEMRG